MLHYFITFTLILTNISCQDLTIRNLHNDLIMMQKNSLCRIQTGNIRVVHPINLTDIEITINQLTNLVYRKQNNNALFEISKYKIRELYSNFMQIKPISHKRSKRWDIIGTAWKWIAGSPDAQDLRIIDRSLNELVNENNHQVKINHQIGKRISELTTTINELIEKQQINQIILDELDVITTILNIDTLNKILTSVQEAILFSKMHVTNSRMLSGKEIHLIKDILRNQGVQLDIPEEALNFVTPKMATSENTLLYILHVPELETEESTIMRIHPLSQNDSIIKTYPQFLIKQAKQLFTTAKPDDYVQRHSFIKEFKDLCIYPLIMGTEPQCLMEINAETTTKLITNNKILISNAKNQELRSNCGPSDRYLSGNFIVSFSNCTIEFMDQNFTSTEKISESESIQGALHNLQINSEILQNHDVAKIEKATLLNRRKLEKVSLQHETDQIWKWSLLGGTALMSTLLFFTLYLIFIHLRFTHKRTSRKTHQRKPETKSPGHGNQELSIEDDTSSPPGGVTT